MGERLCGPDRVNRNAPVHQKISCWANHYQNIKENPNFAKILRNVKTSIIMTLEINLETPKFLRRKFHIDRFIYQETLAEPH